MAMRYHFRSADAFPTSHYHGCCLSQAIVAAPSSRSVWGWRGWWGRWGRWGWWGRRGRSARAGPSHLHWYELAVRAKAASCVLDQHRIPTFSKCSLAEVDVAAVRSAHEHYGPRAIGLVLGIHKRRA